MPPNRFESEVGNFLEGSHGDRTHIKRAGHHTVTPLCGTLLRGSNERDDQNVVDVISNSLHPLPPSRSTKSPEFMRTRGICSCDWIRTSNRPINSRMLCR